VINSVLAVLAGIAATGFTFDLARDAVRRPRPHVLAYTAGMAAFAIATWALAFGVLTGWSSASYRVFFLFGTVINVLLLAVGSMFLVVGRRSGHAFFLFTGAIAAMATTLITTVPFVEELPDSGIPADMWGPDIVFGPKLFAVIGGVVGGTTIVILGLVSLVRFWRKNPRIVVGNALIVGGTLAASVGGTQLGFLDETATFDLSLMLAALLIWAGYRVTRGARSAPPPPPTIVLAGPSIESPERAHAELMISKIERAGYRVICPARDIEDWGNVGYSPQDAMAHTRRAIDSAKAVVVDLHHGYGVVAAGYAYAVGVPVLMAAPEGSRVPRPLQGVAVGEVYYRSIEDVVSRLAELVPPGTPVELAPLPEPVA
jgi:2'-deoxynucleoside 5'-phosphate N-hydrolase